MQCGFKVSQIESCTLSYEYVMGDILTKIDNWAKKHDCYSVSVKNLCVFENRSQFVICIEDAILTREEMQEIFPDGCQGKIEGMKFWLTGQITPIITED